MFYNFIKNILNFENMNIAIIIQHPERLKKLFPPKNGLPEGTIKASYGNFGLIPYGHSMVSKF